MFKLKKIMLPITISISLGIAIFSFLTPSSKDKFKCVEINTMIIRQSKDGTSLSTINRAITLNGHGVGRIQYSGSIQYLNKEFQPQTLERLSATHEFIYNMHAGYLSLESKRLAIHLGNTVTNKELVERVHPSLSPGYSSSFDLFRLTPEIYLYGSNDSPRYRCLKS